MRGKKILYKEKATKKERTLEAEKGMAILNSGEAGPGTEKNGKEEMDTRGRDPKIDIEITKGAVKNGKRIIGEVRLHIDTTRMEQ